MEAERALPLERPIRTNLIQKFIDSTEFVKEFILIWV